MISEDPKYCKILVFWTWGSYLSSCPSPRTSPPHSALRASLFGFLGLAHCRVGNASCSIKLLNGVILIFYRKCKPGIYYSNSVLFVCISTMLSLLHLLNALTCFTDFVVFSTFKILLTKLFLLMYFIKRFYPLRFLICNFFMYFLLLLFLHDHTLYVTRQSLMQFSYFILLRFCDFLPPERHFCYPSGLYNSLTLFIFCVYVAHSWLFFSLCVFVFLLTT